MNFVLDIPLSIAETSFETICGENGVFPDLDSDCEKYYVCNGQMVICKEILKNKKDISLRFGDTHATRDCCLMPRLVHVIGDSLWILNVTLNFQLKRNLDKNVKCINYNILKSTNWLTIQALYF